MKLGFLNFVHVPPSPPFLFRWVQGSRGHSAPSTHGCTQHPYPSWSCGYFLMMNSQSWLRVKGLKSESLKELPTFPTLCLCAYSFLPWSNFNKDYVTTWCWHSMSNIIPSVSRENVKTCVSITLRFQFSTVKNQATLKLQTAFQNYLVIFIVFFFFFFPLDIEFRHL